MNPNGDSLYKIYPNPSEDNLKIDFLSHSGLEFLKLYDQSGQFIFGAETREIHTLLDINHLFAGTYILNFRDENMKQLGEYKIVKL